MESIEYDVRVAATEVGVSEMDQLALFSFLAPLRDKNPTTHVHYLHSLRVGLLSRRIAQVTAHDERALLLSGLLHDLGKCQVCTMTLGKSDGWTDRDTAEIRRHTLDGHRLLAGRFDFTADTTVRHHAFQGDAYPRRLPAFLHAYSPATKLLIVEHARLVAIADVYDALHRENDKFGAKRLLDGTEIRRLMYELNRDRAALIGTLYDRGVFSL